METYTKEQLLGYLIMSLQNLGVDEEEIRNVVYRTMDNIDEFTEVWAEEVYEKFM